MFIKLFAVLGLSPKKPNSYWGFGDVVWKTIYYCDRT